MFFFDFLVLENELVCSVLSVIEVTELLIILVYFFDCC